jgi:hypothetical protein
MERLAPDATGVGVMDRRDEPPLRLDLRGRGQDVTQLGDDG